jgi:tyrosine-protein kinase Etk/Wzc
VEVKNDLTNAENRLKIFRENNRKVMDSPNLLLAQERLTREVELQNALYIELKKQYEIVKVEEVRNTPVVDVLDKAEPPVKRYKPKRTMIVISMVVLSFGISVFLVFVWDFYRENKKNIRSMFRV